MLYLIPIIPLILLITAVILRRWRTGIVLLFVWLLVEDVIRRLVPGQPGQIMLIKDVLIVLAYFSFLAAITIKNKKIWNPPFTISLSLFVGFSLINVFNPQAPNLFFGIIGLRSYLWYIPLIFLGYYMFTSFKNYFSREKLLKFCRILVYLTIPLLIFTVFQYLFFETDMVLVRPLTTTHQYHSFGLLGASKIPLLSSVFGSAHRYARFLMFLFFLGMGFLTIKRNKLLLISVICAVFGIILSGSRSAFILTVIGAVLFLLFMTYIKNNRILHLWRKNWTVIFAAVTVLVLLLPIIFLINKDIILFHAVAFYFTFKERIPWLVKELSRAFSEAKFFGAGTGTMSQGLEYVPGGAEWIKYQTEEVRQGFWFETGVGKILFELGFMGLFLFYLFWGQLFYEMKKKIRELKESSLKGFGVAIFIFSLLMLIWFSFLHHQSFGDATTLVVLWFSVGVLFSLRGNNHEYTNQRQIYE